MITENLNKFLNSFFGRLQKVYNMYTGIFNIASSQGQILIQKSQQDGNKHFYIANIYKGKIRPRIDQLVSINIFLSIKERFKS